MPSSKKNLPEDYAISVVIPVYNEEGNVIPLADELVPVMDRIGRGFEVIFVNDASADGTLEKLRQLVKKDKRIRVLSFKENCGQTSAFDAGFKAARNHVIITMDGDMQNDPSDIPNLLERIVDHDLVVGWRWQRRDKFVKRISSKIANAIRRRGLHGDGFHDTGCSLKAFRRDAVMRLKLFNYMHRFFPVLFGIEGLRACEVKVNHRERERGKSKYGIGNRALVSWRAMKFVRYMQDHKLKYKIEEEL